VPCFVALSSVSWYSSGREVKTILSSLANPDHLLLFNCSHPPYQKLKIQLRPLRYFQASFSFSQLEKGKILQEKWGKEALSLKFSQNRREQKENNEAVWSSKSEDGNPMGADGMGSLSVFLSVFLSLSLSPSLTVPATYLLNVSSCYHRTVPLLL
jgi:hypothetical protein